MNIIGQFILNQFRVDAFIASGGMGAVYRVWDIKRNVPLAMKILASDLTDNPQILKRFEREARSLRKLAHPHIVPFYGLYQADNLVFLLEGYVDGPSLDLILKQRDHQPLPLNEILTYFKAISSALGYAHAMGIIHCDVKPGNILIDNNGQIYLTDFGIASFSESTTQFVVNAGTPAYMSPEQILGEPLSPASDVYALGVMLYEMATGQRPFLGNDTAKEFDDLILSERIRYAHLKLPVPDPREVNPSIHPKIAEGILKALSKDPNQRYQNATEFYMDIQSATSERDALDKKKHVESNLETYKQPLREQSDQRYATKSAPKKFRFGIVIIVTLLLNCLLAYFIFKNFPSYPPIQSLTPSITLSPSPSVTPSPSPSVTPVVTSFPTLSVTSTPTQIIAPALSPIDLALEQLYLLFSTHQNMMVLTVAVGINFILIAGILLLVKRGNNIPVENANTQQHFKKTSFIERDLDSTLITALDARKRNEIIQLVGREHELRLKDKIIFYSGQKCILRGYGRFGGTSLVTQIVERAKNDIAKNYQSRSLLLTARLEFRSNDNVTSFINAIVREIHLDVLRTKYSKPIEYQLKKLRTKQSIKDLSSENSISVKATALLGEASFTRKSGKTVDFSNTSLSDEDLLEIFGQILDGEIKGNQLHPLERLIAGMLANKSFPARIIIIVDKIDNGSVFDILRQLKILDDERIFVFGIVKQNHYLSWSKETKENLEMLGFESLYIPCLWEKEHCLIEALIESISPINQILIEEEPLQDGLSQELSDLRDHIAYLSRGAPGDAIRRLLSTDVCTFHDGIPLLDIKAITIKQWDLIKYNANRERLLRKYWEKILAEELKGIEELDQAKIGIYQIMDWIYQEIGFTKEQLIEEVHKNKLPIAHSKLIRVEIALRLLEILVSERFLVKMAQNRYRVNKDWLFNSSGLK